MRGADEITLRKLEIFLAFMREQNLARAAETLGVSSVSVHKAIHSLEAAVGAPLFAHRGRTLRPLASAEVLARHGQDIIDGIQRSVDATRQAAGIAPRTFRIGSLYSLTISLVPRIITAVQAALPGCDIELVLGSNATLEDQLAAGEIDAALICTHELARSHARAVVDLFEDEIYLVTPAERGAARRDTAKRAPVDLADYREAPFVVLSQEFSSGRDSYRMFQTAGITPRVALRANDIFSLSGLVRGNVGYALLPGRIAELYPGALAFQRVRRAQAVSQHVGLCHLASRAEDESIGALIAAAREIVAPMVDSDGRLAIETKPV
ncbi:LysR family transcriptional regulator [Salinisphaera japonica]|uniref:LysR family transcriptional regulator n=1 Tax=Salinisphaera japonica YTM-1 TaxID=1209778 RepID=A0A423PRB7_9GAMM|nr:LysR family transcriptional regulator [Salinisphaera japonica]ROO28127.1 LysR family transcriptional regulator [Salinisphaera japonica YTM-1]